MTIQERGSRQGQGGGDDEAERPWRLLRERELARDNKLTVYQNDYELPGGERRDGFLLLAEDDGTIVVAFTEQEEVLLVRQHREGVGHAVYELPAGYVEKEEGPDHALQRAQAELREETGYESDAWHALGVVYSSTNRLKKRDHCFLALGARRVAEQDLDEGESVRYEVAPLAEIERMVDDGRFPNAECIAALYMGLRRRERLSSGATNE